MGMCQEKNGTNILMRKSEREGYVHWCVEIKREIGGVMILQV